MIIPLLSVIVTIVGPPLVMFGISQWIYCSNNGKLLRKIQQNPDRVQFIKIIIEDGQKPVIGVHFKDEEPVVAFSLSVKSIQNVAKNCHIHLERENIDPHSEI